MIGDFACLTNKVSEWLYRVSETVTGLAIKKESFVQILEDKEGQLLVPKIKRYYRNNIREYCVQHREIQAMQFQSRIDYVDLSAFGVGVNYDDLDHFRQAAEDIDR